MQKRVARKCKMKKGYKWFHLKVFFPSTEYLGRPRPKITSCSYENGLQVNKNVQNNMTSFMDNTFGVQVKLSAECRRITVIWVSWSIIDDLLLHTTPNADGRTGVIRLLQLTFAFASIGTGRKGRIRKDRMWTKGWMLNFKCRLTNLNIYF
jgi:hypothetical protein